jgi:hypothetical protein
MQLFSVRSQRGSGDSPVRRGRVRAPPRLARPKRASAVVLGCLLAGLAGSATIAAASATPYADINAFWSVLVNSQTTIPSGITISCFGGATSLSDGCTDSRSIDLSVTGAAHLSANTTSGIVITNMTDQAFAPTNPFITEFSAFNAGGPEIGIGIDDPVSQAASFASAVSGPEVGDFHSCSVGFLGDSGQMFSPTTCGVENPDSSQGSIFVDVAPGQSERLSYSIGITADFTVPEASSLSILVVALAALGAGSRRRRDRGRRHITMP